MDLPDAPDNELTSIRDLGPALVLAPGGSIGRYELRDKLGRGTFGLVFAAHDPDLDRVVALKVLNPAHATNRDLVQRFLQEARATARIAHPGVVTLLDFGRVPTSLGETAYITMEMLGGESLTSRLHDLGRLPADHAIEIARQVASALEAAHRVEVLHRDLKPDNIFLVPDPAVASGERIKVLDFGLAKLGVSGHTLVNTVFGTPRYMSPEQCRSSGEIDQRSDIYALGVILFELVTGVTPFDGDLRVLMYHHQVAVPPRASVLAPKISLELDDLIARMLHKDPAARPQSMGDVQLELAHVATARPMIATPRPPTAPRPATPRPFEPAEESMGELLVPPQAERSAEPAPLPVAPSSRKNRVWFAAVIAFFAAIVVAAAVL